MKAQKMIKKIMFLLGIILIAGAAINIGTETSKGSIQKTVQYTGDPATPIHNAKVMLEDENHVFVDVGYTNYNGIVTFSDLPYGTYYINVDIENDGTYETEDEETLLDQNSVTVINEYTPLTVSKSPPFIDDITS